MVGVTDTQPFWLGFAVGERVVVRYRLERPAAAGSVPGPALTDALGYVVAVGKSGLVVRTRSGDVAIPADAITIGKRVPPPPPRTTRRY